MAHPTQAGPDLDMGEGCSDEAVPVIAAWSRAAVGFLPWILGSPKTPGQIQQVDSPWGSVVCTMGVWESRIGDSTCWIVPEVRRQSCLRIRVGVSTVAGRIEW